MILQWPLSHYDTKLLLFIVFNITIFEKKLKAMLFHSLEPLLHYYVKINFMHCKKIQRYYENIQIKNYMIRWTDDTIMLLYTTTQLFLYCKNFKYEMICQYII